MLVEVRSGKLEVGSGEMGSGRGKMEVGRKNYRLKAFFFGICFFFFGISSYAQCAMCRAALAGEGNKAKAAAVNDGIVYLMVIPYVLVAGIGYYIYRMRKKKT
jgi:hypothetical protein